MAEETTLIRVSVSTKKRLDEIGKKTDSYDDIIKRELEFKTALWNIRSELYDALPSGDINAFDLIKLIKTHIKGMDDLIDRK